VAGVHSGRGVCTSGGRSRCGDGTDDSFKFPARNASEAVKDRMRFGQREDCRLDADLARATIEDVVDVIAEAAADVVGGGGRELGEAVGARRGQRDTGSAGMRSPTVGRPAVTMSGISARLRLAWPSRRPGWPRAAVRTKVNGPGQNFSTSCWAAAGHSVASDFAISIEAT
jgi:hypothetical protein